MAKLLSRLEKFWLETKRIFQTGRKPTKKEFGLTVKISLVGLAIIGGLSYIIQLISEVITRAFD
ncbi:MAG: protein translocase SEC61 complex subunit gamma [Candidatus Lokiarchaeota archaeon]|nr:protein translocase SEC61 complex subunit gamma [Candidatus Lokiarchaeota archaeon]